MAPVCLRIGVHRERARRAVLGVVHLRIVIIGADGQLGSDLRVCLPGEIIPLDVPVIDVCDEASVRAALANSRPDLVINCAAMTHVDNCEQQAELAMRVNAIGAGNVARVTDELGAAVVYISTDYVFGAQPTRRTAYVEHDTPGPVNVYGRTKLLGEQHTRQACERHFIVRTCGLYGHAGALGKGGNFVETMCKLAAGEKPIRVVADQRLSPTSTRALSEAIAQLIETDCYGLYHLTASDSCTWHEFASAIVHSVAPTREVVPIPSSEYPTPAARPAFSALRSVRAESAGLSQLPSWREMLEAYLAARDKQGAT